MLTKACTDLDFEGKIGVIRWTMSETHYSKFERSKFSKLKFGDFEGVNFSLVTSCNIKIRI